MPGFHVIAWVVVAGAVAVFLMTLDRLITDLLESGGATCVGTSSKSDLVLQNLYRVGFGASAM